MSRKEPAVELAGLVAELVDEVTTRTGYDYRPDDRKPSARRTHETRRPGLVTQVTNIAGPPTFAAAAFTAPIRYDSAGGKSAAVVSSAPANLVALDLLADLHAVVPQLVARARTETGQAPSKRTALEGMLRELVGLAPSLQPRLLRAVLAELRSWRTQARIALAYEAPMATLHAVCFVCGGDLKVRADASGDVFCAGGGFAEGPAEEGARWPIPYRGCGATWPRTTWVLLLDEDKSEGTSA